MARLNIDDLVRSTVQEMLPRMQEQIMHGTSYFGVTAYKNPVDAWSYQEIIFETHPDVIVEIGNMFGGSALMMAHWLDQLRHGKVIGVDLDHGKVAEIVRSHPRITFIEGDGCESVQKVRKLIDPWDRVMVIEDSDHTYDNTLNVLRAYGDLVSPGNYFIVEDGIINHGLNRMMDRGPYEAVETFLAENSEFKVDVTRERLLTWNPNGYLKRLEQKNG